MSDSTRKHGFSTARSLLFSALIFGAFFAGAELLLHWVDPRPPLRPRLVLRAIDVDIEFPFMRPDPELFWVPRPGFSGEFLGHQVRINSRGLRGPELRVPRPPGRRRLVCFGDSITFGYGVADEQTYPARLQAGLAARGVEVANAGVTGYTSHQVLGRLRRLAPELGASVASFCVGWNDGTLRPVADRVYARRLRTASAVGGALEHWRLYRFVSGLYVRRQLRVERELQEREQARVSLDEYRLNLEAIVETCRRHGIAPVFLALPHRRSPGEARAETPYAAALALSAERLGVPLLPLGRLGLDGDLEDTRSLFIDSLHLSAEGNQALADMLAEQLVALDLL